VRPERYRLTIHGRPADPRPTPESWVTIPAPGHEDDAYARVCEQAADLWARGIRCSVTVER